MFSHFFLRFNNGPRSSTTMAARTVLSSPSSLRTHLKSRLPVLRRSPCILVSSDLPADEQSAPNPPPPIKAFRHSISESVNRAGFTASMELGLRTVNCTVTSAYPTWDDIESGVEMARRVGATTVVGVGAGAAVDCAKAVASALSSSAGAENSDNAVELILAPSTLGGTMAAMSSSPLFLSTAEESLLPPHLACTAEKSMSLADFAPAGATVCLDGDGMTFVDANYKSMAVATPTDAALASLTICVESSLLLADISTASTNAEELEIVHTLMEGTRSNAVATLEAYRDTQDVEAQKVAHQHAAAAVAHAAQLLRFGDGADRIRSISIALCSSLLPRYFPHGHALTFMASLFPGICESVGDNNIAIRIGEEEIDNFAHWSGEITDGLDVPKLAAMAEGTPDVDTMLKKVDANSALVGCQEVGGYDFVEAVLHRSLNR